MLFNLHSNYLGATIVTEKFPMCLSLALVFFVSSNTDLKNVMPLFHTGRAGFMFFWGAHYLAFPLPPAIYHVGPTPDGIY